MKINLLTLAAGALLLASCSSHFISDKAFRAEVQADFDARSEVLSAAGVCLGDLTMTQQETEAMQFLYAYMPLGDLVNLSPEYFLENVRLTEEALRTMPWGRTVPERELRHFVLPVRVNNENLDTSRTVFFNELRPRVAGLSMQDAILEVNHWCHEKAVYQPSDSRTSSPLATVKTAYGRCGEESTLLVAALRAVGIPARQVYTPRWAHTDDNHAWVEAWADGSWHFLGACEPEPVLDLGWFNAPASRGMLMHTKVFGKYDGPEEVVDRTKLYTEINVIENYAAASARVDVTVTDAQGNPVPGARVEYRLYNYAEFYPVAVKNADADGRSYLTAGLGDIIVYATDGENFGFRKVSFGKDEDVQVQLTYNEANLPNHIALESVPPAENVRLPEVSPEMRAENDRRMAAEDSIRTAYVATFPDQSAGDLLFASRGNHAEIKSFLEYAESQGRGEDAEALLRSVSEKDLRDTPFSVLKDHLDNMPLGCKDEHIYGPRVYTELLTPYRGALLEEIPQEMKDAVLADPSYLVGWCSDSLSLNDSISMRYVQLSPLSVFRTRLADKDSRDIFFVAACRTLGVPAWKDAVTGTVKYRHGGRTLDVDFDAAEKLVAKTGTLILEYTPIPLLADPGYYTHFTLSKFDDGKFNLLNYPDEAAWKADFASGATVPEGKYLLTSGARMSGGNVLADMEFFEVRAGETVRVPLIVRDDPSQYRVIGSFNSEALYDKVPAPGSGDLSGKVRKSVLAETGRGYFAIALVDYGKEPTDHAMRDISAAADQLAQWGRPLLVIFATENDWKRFGAEKYNLPPTVSYGIDTDGAMRKMMMEGMNLSGDGRLPLIAVADTFNRVVFFSEGYSIGLGDRLVRVSHSL